MKKLFILFLILALLVPMVACSDDCCDDQSMDVRGTLTVVNETNQPVSETINSVDDPGDFVSETGKSVDGTNRPVALPVSSGLVGQTSGTAVMYAVNIHFTVVSNINVAFTSDEAGEVPFHTLYWGNVARGGDTLTFNFWAHNLGEEVTFHSDISCEYMSLTPPLNVTLAPGESREFFMSLIVPIDAPLGDQECTIEFVEGSFMG